MSGILDKKQRLIDFILTADGYKQVENGDLRFVYATLTDKDAIYDRRQDEYNVADITTMPFSFETNSSFFDKLNVEIDLRQTANFELRTEIDGQYIDLRNNEYTNKRTQSASIIFDKLSNNFVDNLSNQRIILTDHFFNSNQSVDKISLYVSKINDNNIDLSNNINVNNQDLTINIESFSDLKDYYTIVNQDSLNLSKTSMLEDDRFQNKLNYLFLPPANMNTDVITKNNKIINSYNLAVDNRNIHKLIFKNFKLKAFDTIDSRIVEDFKNLDTSFDDIILESIQILKNKEFNVAKFELTFENKEYESEFILNLSELNTSDDGMILNKLLFVNHGEIFDVKFQKNVQVYSVGKLLTSKTEVDLDNNFRNNLSNGQYIIEDNYLFINLFTIVIE